MNLMGHDVRTYIGADIKKAAERLKKLVPGYMPMGTDGMSMMGEMAVPTPTKTLPMMTGTGQFRPDRDGRHVLVSSRSAKASPNDYKDPGPFPAILPKSAPTTSAPCSNRPGTESAFPSTRIGPFKNSETEIDLTARGFRLATSVGGMLTGRGGDTIVIDDPLKPDDAKAVSSQSMVHEYAALPA
jgi:hypothetical protein